MNNLGKTDTFYFEGLDDILIAMVKQKDGIGIEPTYDKVTRLPIATKIGVKGNGSVLEKWASSKMFRRVSRETKHEIGLDNVGIPVEVMDELKGLLAVRGVTFGKNTSREYPFFAFGFIGNVEGGGKKAVWYPKVQLSNVIDEEYATAEEDIKIDDVTANLVAVGLNYNNVMYASLDTYRESSKPGDFEKFISQPIFSEEQWQKVLGGGDNG